MPFLLLICLMTVCLPIEWPEPPFGVGASGSLVLTGAQVALLLIGAGAIAQRTRARLVGERDNRDAIARRYTSARTYFFFANLGGFAVSLLLLGWGWAARQLGQIDWDDGEVFVPGGELLVLAPYLLAQIGSWCLFYDADREFHRQLTDDPPRVPFWTRTGYVLFLFRQQFVLVFAPIVLLMGQQGLERLFPEAMQAEWLPLASLLILPLFLIFFPLLLPTLLGLKPLPPGADRDRLEANAHRLRFRYSRIYLWDTRGDVANAMIVGIIPWIRYVVFTDRLLEDLSEDEVDGVFGHEIGHAKHGHMLYYGLFLVLSFIFMGGFVESVHFIDEDFGRDYRTLFVVAPVVVMGVYMFSAFGFISRRCERQADIFGCRAVSCGDPLCYGHELSTPLAPEGKGLCSTGIAAFVRALRRVEDLNGMTRERPIWSGTGLLGKLNWIFRLLTGWLQTWQHSTISKRIAFLESIARDPEIERRFQARVWLVKCGVILLLAGGIIGLGLWKGWNVLLA